MSFNSNISLVDGRLLSDAEDEHFCISFPLDSFDVILMLDNASGILHSCFKGGLDS